MAKLESQEFDGSYIPWAVASFIVCLILFKINCKIVALMYPQVNKFTTVQSIELSTRVTSSVHACIVTAMCSYVLLFDEEVATDPIWTDSALVRTSCAIVAGYMLSDTVLIAIYFKEIGETFYLFHHFASMYAYYFVMSYGVVPWFANFRLLAEFSTPFVNKRWLFDALGWKKTEPPVFTNGILMTTAFFVFRILAMGPFWYKVYTVYGTEDFVKTGHIQYVLLITCIVLDIINVHWFNRMLKGVRKVLTAMVQNSNDTSKVQ